MSQQPKRSKREPSAPRVSAVSAHVGMRMRLRRRMLDLDLGNLAILVQIPEAALAGYEDGTSIIDVPTLFRIGAALEVPMHWFYDGIDPAIYGPLEQPGRSVESAAREINATLVHRADNELLATYLKGLDQSAHSTLVQIARLLAEKATVN